MGFSSLRGVMRGWGNEKNAEDLSQWLRQHGFPATRPGNHIPARVRRTSRSRGRDDHGGIESVPNPPRVEVRRRPAQVDVPATLPEGTWEQLDQVDLEEILVTRVPMLKSCAVVCGSVSQSPYAKDIRQRRSVTEWQRIELGKHLHWCP